MSAFNLLLALFVAACALGAVLAPVLDARHAARIVAWAGSAAALLLTAAGAVALFTAAAADTVLWTLPALGPVMVHRDPLAGVFLIVTGLVMLPVAIYAADALPQLPAIYSRPGYAVLAMAMYVSIAWVLVAGDVFSFLLAWEIMSVLAYLLVVFEHEEREHRRAAYLMLAVGEAGALTAMVGLLLLAAHAGSLGFTAIRASAGTVGGGMRFAVFLLTFLGFGVKAGLVPVNFWLPRAYTAAPKPFAPLLAGATLNLGLYGIFRVNASLLPAASIAPGVIALVIGALSALVGILYATTENDLKTLLAHSSIENAGIIVAGFGAGLVFTAADKPVLAAVAFLVALYHLVNHSLYKTLLFIGAGVVDRHAGSRSLERLGGLIRRMPWTTAAVLAGVLSITALPPFNGFVSEWLTLQILLRSGELASPALKVVFALCGAGLALTAGLAVTCFVKFFAMGFLGMARSTRAETAQEAPRTSLFPLLLLAVLCLLLGVLPTYTIVALDHAVQPLTHASAAAALVPPFFSGSPGHAALPAGFLSDFHSIGAQVGQRFIPGPGLVILHRGGAINPVVFAASPSYLLLVLAGLLFITFLVVRVWMTRRRTLARRLCWDGGIHRLLPEMTYTATGFSNPVRVIFQAVFRPTTVEDTRETVAEHFRTAIHRHDESVHIVDRLTLVPIRKAAFKLSRQLARMHYGRLNAYTAYGLISLLIVFVVFRVF